MAKRTNRMAWGLASILAALLLGGIWLFGVRLRPYWMAKYRGEEADLSGALLISAPLAGAALWGADLTNAGLEGADLTGANLTKATVTGARYDALTRWPAGFDPGRRGAIRMR